jgi:hypothetical protein
MLVDGTLKEQRHDGVDHARVLERKVPPAGFGRAHLNERAGEKRKVGARLDDKLFARCSGFRTERRRQGVGGGGTTVLAAGLPG